MRMCEITFPVGWCYAGGGILLVALVSGCGGYQLPDLYHPGPAGYQRAVATQRHDPYPLDDVAEPVVGGRPREFQRPVPAPSGRCNSIEVMQSRRVLRRARHFCTGAGWAAASVCGTAGRRSTSGAAGAAIPIHGCSHTNRSADTAAKHLSVHGSGAAGGTGTLYLWRACSAAGRAGVAVADSAVSAALLRERKAF